MMSLTAREWLLLPKEEQNQRGHELSEEECFKLRMELSEIGFTEEDKRQITEEQKYNFIHQSKKTEKELENASKSIFESLQQFEMLPKEVTWEERVKRGQPSQWD